MQKEYGWLAVERQRAPRREMPGGSLRLDRQPPDSNDGTEFAKIHSVVGVV